MKTSEIKKYAEAAKLLERRQELMNLWFKFENTKQGRLALIFGQDEYTFPKDEYTKEFITIYQVKISAEIAKVQRELDELGVEEDEGW